MMGTGYIDISTEILPSIHTLLPSTYEIVGSMESHCDKTVRLKLRSEMIVGDGNHLTCEVKDMGSTRKVMVVPV